MAADDKANGKRRLRSREWFDAPGDPTMAALYLERYMNFGLTLGELHGNRPIIGIANTWSELVTCQVHLRELAGFVKRGVWEAGGLPREFPTISLGESMMKPTTMLWRNLMSMDVEESLRANPLENIRNTRMIDSVWIAGGKLADVKPVTDTK